MSRLWSLVLLASGCVIHTDDLKFDDPDDDDDVSLWVQPNDVQSGSTVVLTVTDDYGEVDFDETWDVRSLGDFTIVEWSGARDRLTVVIEVDVGARGEQPLALDTSEGTAYATFQAY